MILADLRKQHAACYLIRSLLSGKPRLFSHLSFKHTGMVIMACGIIRGCATIKTNTKFNVVCTRLVLHCGTNRGCGINRGNTVIIIWRNGQSLL